MHRTSPRVKLSVTHRNLSRCLNHHLGRRKLSLFDVYDPPRVSSRRQEICLAAQKCGNLQYVGDLRNGGRLVRLVDVRHNGQLAIDDALVNIFG
jgi:hypothetical protein